MSKFLDRRWMLKGPDTEIHKVVLSATEGKHGDRLLGNIFFTINAQPCLGVDMTQDDKDKSFYVVRDDMLHPLVNGNKARKLDALLPLLEDHSITDVVRLLFLLVLRLQKHIRHSCCQLEFKPMFGIIHIGAKYICPMCTHF